MSSKGPVAVICLIAICLVAVACSPAVPSTNMAPATAAQATEAPLNAKPATATVKPTKAPTPTPWPPVLDLFKLGDIRELDSFIVTINVKNTVNGDLTETTTTIGYLKEPFSGYALLDLGSDDTKTYVVNSRTYDVNNFGDWYLSTTAKDSFLFAANIPMGNTVGLEEAEFVEVVEFEGLPAYHFVLEKTDEPPNESNVKSDIEGEIILAQDGYYVLYSHSKRTTTQGTFTQAYEVTHSMSAINQLTEVTLPADFLPMDEALAVPQELGLPLPQGSQLSGMVRYNSGGIGVDYYTYAGSLSGNDEFLQFYRDLALTDGWTVSHIGYVNLHYECEFYRECVIINKGSTQVILFYKSSSIGADFDWSHVYSPLTP
jgi:hypothetical protein